MKNDEDKARAFLNAWWNEWDRHRDDSENVDDREDERKSINREKRM